MNMISVIIPHLNQPRELRACLDSLRAQSFPPARFEVVVVDNGSATPPREIVACYPGVRLFHETLPGPGPARNRGVAAATGEILAFIDADCRAHPDWLTNLSSVLISSSSGTILGGDVRIWSGGSEARSAVAAYESVFAYRFKLYIERQGYAGTGNLAMYRRDFEAIGPFAGIDVAEDMEWGKRARRAGRRFCYVPDMIVFHPARSSLRELYDKWDRQILHYRNMANGNPAWQLRWLAKALAVLASPLFGVVTVLTSDRIEGCATRCKAIAVLCAIRVHRAMTMLALLSGERRVAWNRSRPE
jgi:glycosyltransferase involved in cell wall biosynthesis